MRFSHGTTSNELSLNLPTSDDQIQWQQAEKKKKEGKLLSSSHKVRRKKEDRERAGAGRLTAAITRKG